MNEILRNATPLAYASHSVRFTKLTRHRLEALCYGYATFEQNRKKKDSYIRNFTQNPSNFLIISFLVKIGLILGSNIML